MDDSFDDQINRLVRRKFQKVFDTVFGQHAGQSVEDVKAALVREFADAGATITDPKLTQYATAMSKGTQIKVRAA
jgi:hypothetical protein